MSTQDAVTNIIAASTQLSPAAMPVMRSWLREQSGGAVSDICPNQLSAWLSRLRPDQIRSEHDWALQQVNYLAYLLPQFKK